MLFVNQPARATQAAAGDADDRTGPDNFVALLLSPLPKTIHALWHVYKFGIGGHKPAYDFNATEQGGKHKHLFYCHRVVWMLSTLSFMLTGLQIGLLLGL